MSDENLTFEIDGPEVHKATVDAEAALNLFVTYLGLIRKVAKARGTELTFHGLEVEEKCLRFGAAPSNPGAAQAGVLDISAMLANQLEIPNAIRTPLSKFQRQVREFPQTILRSSAQVGHWQPVILHFDTPVAEFTPVAESFSGRAIVTRVGGKKPTVRLMTRIEDKEMTLTLEKELATRIAPFLYKEVDIDARVFRDEEGHIADGNLLDFEPVSDGDPTAAWEEALREGMGPRSGLTLEELHEELGRD
ncbi:hypothetical protein [Myxococcus sp. SDU36]|uniref:hypothetical protein n=1 Tax=Myxococcus sp. SDU36 TaxID=2831967 RepID=UPI00254390C5|nr:hypothetical protein [Myxococcus sp. SDU36]WIG92732.1 hypothetical protein KGD87_19010 [Myxococcus sp. SDU36]